MTNILAPLTADEQRLVDTFFRQDDKQVFFAQAKRINTPKYTAGAGNGILVIDYRPSMIIPKDDGNGIVFCIHNLYPDIRYINAVFDWINDHPEYREHNPYLPYGCNLKLQINPTRLTATEKLTCTASVVLLQHYGGGEAEHNKKNTLDDTAYAHRIKIGQFYYITYKDNVLTIDLWQIANYYGDDNDNQ